FPLVARASRSKARSPWSATPPIRFLFVGSWFGSPLPSAVLADAALLRAFALRFAWSPRDQLLQRTFTSLPCPCWARLFATASRSRLMTEPPSRPFLPPTPRSRTRSLPHRQTYFRVCPSYA